jgi:hypothetical protein
MFVYQELLDEVRNDQNFLLRAEFKPGYTILTQKSNAVLSVENVTQKRNAVLSVEKPVLSIPKESKASQVKNMMMISFYCEPTSLVNFFRVPSFLKLPAYVKSVLHQSHHEHTIVLSATNAYSRWTTTAVSLFSYLFLVYLAMF